MYSFFDKTFQLFQGNVYFSAENGFFNVFINKCKHCGIPLYNVHIEDNVLYAKTDYKFYGEVIKASFDSGVDLTVIKKTGIPYWLHKNKKRFGIPAGIILACFIFLYLSSVIWSVEISGVEANDIEVIKSTLAECGIKRGAFIACAEKDEAEDRLGSLNATVKRASISITGCKAFVEIFERELPPETGGEKQYSNITASKDGEIVKADIFQGDSEVTQGQSVKKGDLLVSGVVEMKDERVRFTDSEARIIARTENLISSSAAKELYVDVVTKRQNCYTVYFFGLKIPLSQSEPGEKVSSNEYFLRTDNTVFPVGIMRKCVTFTEKKDICLSDDATLLMCMNDFALNLHEKLYDRNIVSVRAQIENKSYVCVEAVVMCEEDICEKTYFYADKTEEQETSE